MPTPSLQSQTGDKRIDRRIGVLLRTGMICSATVIVFGGLLHLIAHGRTVPDNRLFRGEPLSLTTPAGIFAGVLQGDSLCVIQFGMLLLIATPVARVIFSIYAFLRIKDFQYVFIAGIVLGVLVYSLVWH